ncbi:MAG: DNA translocase FtsK 4TM domain-containing protein, partial [Pseudomonadales bacterium]|nr:DNA translocase FtsK 4TM domain-containing protein [Pseudomonadales bacterium]
MAQSRTKNENHEALDHLYLRLKEGGLIVLVAFCLYLFLALVTYDAGDPGWTYTGENRQVDNLMGVSGAWVADVLLFLFGYLAYVFPMMLAWHAWQLFRERRQPHGFNWPLFAFRLTGLVLTMTAGTG